MTAPVNETAAETHDLLEYRLQRIEHLLGRGLEPGKYKVNGELQDKETNVHMRLARVEFGISQLSVKHAVIHDLLKLRKICTMHVKHLHLLFNKIPLTQISSTLQHRTRSRPH